MSGVLFEFEGQRGRQSMKKLVAWYRNCTINEQIRLALIILSVCTAVLLGACSFSISKYTIEKNYKESFAYNLRVSNQIADIQIENIIELSRNLLNNNYFMNDILNGGEEEGKYYSTARSHALERVCSSLTSQDIMIGELVVIDRMGRLYTTNFGEGRNYQSMDVWKNEWMPQIQKAKGKEVFFSYNILNPARTTAFSMGKQLNSPKTGETAGYLVVNIRKELLTEAFKPYDSGYKSLCCMVAGQDGTVTFLRGNEKYCQEIEEKYKEKGVVDDSYLTAELENQLTGWKIISAVKKTELSKEAYLIGGIILVVIFTVVLLGFFIAKHISEWIYRPLNKLEGIIEEVGEGSRNISEEFDTSEIGKIGTKFKMMVNHNLELREHLLSSQLKEREAELLLLQAQINPHFLYNTLDSLYCMAMIHEADDMAEMVEALSDTFRLSLNKGNKLILVKNELEHVRSYMRVQDFRYGERFTLDIRVEQEIENCYILKFILQPFVENAMYHGLEPKLGKGKILVTGKKDGDDLIFTIEDDGVGLQDISILEKGYGIRNVKERIALYYGDKYGVWFHSSPGDGTQVTIKIAAVYTKGEILNEKCSTH